MAFLYSEFSKLRISRGISQEELAELSGVKASRIKNYECGRRRAHLEDVILMCQALNVKVNDYYKKECFTICFLSNKGGSSKSTSSVNVAFTLATEYNKKVLLIDSDMQQNASQHLNIDINDEKNFYIAFTEKQSLMDHILKTEYDNIDIITSHDGMSMIETEMASMELREFRMKQILKPVLEKGDYDFIIIDTNPSLGQLNRSILYASDSVIIPLEASAFGMRGLEFLTRFIDGVKDNYTNLNILGILVNKFDLRKRVPKDVVEMVETKFGHKDLLFKTKIMTDSAIEQAQMMGEPVGVSFPRSRANLGFITLCDEIIKRSERVIRSGKRLY